MFEHEELETLDIVDRSDTVVGSILRGDIMQLRDTPGRYLRAVEVFLQRPNGDIYMPRRSPHKKLFPGSPDLSAAGHLLQGETYEAALMCEVSEELGVTISRTSATLVRRFEPSEKVFYFRNLYLVQSDQVPRLSDEHTEFVWLSLDDLRKFSEFKVPAKDTLYEDIESLLEFLDPTVR